MSFSGYQFLFSGEITSQFGIIDPLNRGVIRIDDNSIIENDFIRYNFSGYSLRDDQIIDFVGSDCHHVHHLEMINHAKRLPVFHSLIQQEQILNKTL